MYSWIGVFNQYFFFLRSKAFANIPDWNQPIFAINTFSKILILSFISISLVLSNKFICITLEIQLSRLGGICCFSATHASLRRKGKDWLARSQDNVSELGTMSIDGLVLQLTSNKQYSLDCWSSTQQASSSSSHWKLTMFLP
jgi:hypothetical protein